MDFRLVLMEQALRRFPKQASALAAYDRFGFDEDQIARAVSIRASESSRDRAEWDAFFKAAAEPLISPPPATVAKPPVAAPAPVVKPAVPTAKPPVPAPVPHKSLAASFNPFDLGGIPNAVGRVARGAVGGTYAAGGVLANVGGALNEGSARATQALGFKGQDPEIAKWQAFRQHGTDAMHAGIADVKNIGTAGMPNTSLDHMTGSAQRMHDAAGGNSLAGSITNGAAYTGHGIAQALPYLATGNALGAAAGAPRFLNPTTGQMAASAVSGAASVGHNVIDAAKHPISTAKSLAVQTAPFVAIDQATKYLGGADAAPGAPSALAAPGAPPQAPATSGAPATPGAPAAPVAHLPIAALTSDTLNKMTPEEAVSRGQAADQRISSFAARAKTMTPEQQQGDIKAICADKFAARCKLSGENPADLMARVEQGGITQDDLKIAQETPGFMDHVKQMGGDAVGTLKAMEPWQQALTIAGVPMALFGIMSSLFGEGGIGSMLMSVLGIGAGAGALGAFGGQGPLSGAMGNIAGHVSTLMGGAPAEPEAPSPASPAPAGGIPPARSGGLGSMMADNKLTQDELNQIMASPDHRRALMSAPTTERDNYVRAMVAGNPRMKSQLNKAYWFGTGRNRDYGAERAKKQLGVEPHEYDALMDSYSRVRSR